MDTTTEQSRALANLGESVCSDSAIVFAVAFGSQISGESTTASDFDLAVKFADGLSERERFERRCYLAGDLQDESLPFVDVSDIESLPVDVAHDAVNGDFLCGDKRAFDRFKATVEAKFEEESETLRRHQRAIIDRIAEADCMVDERVVSVKLEQIEQYHGELTEKQESLSRDEFLSSTTEQRAVERMFENVVPW